MKTEQQQKIQVLTPVSTDEGWIIGVATWGEMGYTPIEGTYPTEQDARIVCDDYNERHGYNKKQAWLIVTKTMFPGCTTTLEDVLAAGTKKV